MLLASSRCATMARLSQKRRLMLLRRTHHNNNNGQTQLLRHFPPAIAGAGPSCSSSPPPPLAMLALPQQRSMIIMATSQHLQSEEAKSTAALLEEQRSKPMKVPPEVLASNSLDLSRNGEQLTVECRQGRSGTIYFQCSLRLPSGNFFNFTTFLAPVGHGIVEALDGLMESLTTLAAAADIVGKFPEDDEKHVVESRRVEHPGREFYFQLELFWLRNGFGLDFRSIARQPPTTASADQPMPPMHRRKRLTLQLRALPWLRQNLAEMLAAVEGGHAEADGFFCLARNAVPAVQLSAAAQEFPYLQWEAVTRKQELAQKREESVELATATLELGGAEQLLLRCKRGKSGLPHFTCSKRLRNGLFFNFPSFLAAPMGQRMVQAMDELLERLTDPDWDNFPRHADEIRVVESRRVANAPDCPFDFQLEIYWLRDGYGLDIRTIRCQQQQQPTAEEEDGGKQPMHTEKVMQLPLRALPWLRQNLADMFAQNVATNIGQQPLAGSGAPIDGSSMAAAAQDFPLAALDIPFQRWEATVRPKLGRAGKTEEKSADGVLKGDVSVIRTGGAIEPGWGRKGEQLATAVLELGGAEQLHLECRRGKSGHAFFQYKKRLPKGRFFNCTPFLAPVGKRMAEAMAELMESLAAMRDMDNFPRNNTKHVVVSRRVANAPGHPFDFQLELFWLRDGFGLDIGIVGCQPEPDANAKDDDKSQETKDDNSQGAANIQIHQQQQRSSRPLTLPLRALPWLRQNLADMFALAEAESGLQHMPKPLNLYGDSGGDDDDGSEPTAQDFPYQRWETTIRPGKK